MTHWLVAEKVAARLPAGSFYGEAARLFEAERALGAVLHDALFYAPKEAQAYAFVADRLHGEGGEDTLAVIRGLHAAVRQLFDARSPRSGPCAALLVGLVSHVFADVTFHPLVYYHTGLPLPNGKLPPAAATCHRRLETLIDFYLVGPTQVATRSLAAYLRATQPRLAELLRLFAQAAAPTEDPEALARALEASLGRFSQAQTLFRCAGLMRAARTARKVLPWSAREVIALGYAPACQAEMLRLAEDIEYLHPATGEPCRGSLRGLTEVAADRAAQAILRVEQALVRKRKGNDPFPEHGPTLVAGLPDVPAAALKHVAQSPLVSC